MLRDHVVDGRAVLPGVGHLDLVAAASGGLTGRALVDVRWGVPLAVTGAGERVVVAFDGEQRYEVRGADDVVRSYGRLGDAVAAPAPVDVAALRARLDEGPDEDAFYRTLAAQGLPYGPFFRRVRQVWTGVDEVPGLGATGGDPVHVLHPGVLDAALHTGAALLLRRRGEHARPMLPFAADRVDVFGAVPTTGWSHVRETGADRFDVLLCDDTGAVRVRFTGLTYREAKPAAVVGHRPCGPPGPPTAAPRAPAGCCWSASGRMRGLPPPSPAPARTRTYGGCRSAPAASPIPNSTARWPSSARPTSCTSSARTRGVSPSTAASCAP